MAACYENLSCSLQDRLGIEITSLVEGAASATAELIAREAHALLSQRTQGVAGAVQGASALQAAGSWVARAPIVVKLRLFCLPYAGGVSENVFGRSVISWWCLRFDVTGSRLTDAKSPRHTLREAK